MKYGAVQVNWERVLFSRFSNLLDCAWEITTENRFLRLCAWCDGVRNLGKFYCAGGGVGDRWKVVGLEAVQADQNRECLLLALWTKGDRLSDARVLISLKQRFQSFVIWYLLCRVFLCTLLIPEINIYIPRWMGIFRWMRAVAIQCTVWKTHRKLHPLHVTVFVRFPKACIFIICTVLISTSWTIFLPD